MELIRQPLDFTGQNIYNENHVRTEKDGKPEYRTVAIMWFPT